MELFDQPFLLADLTQRKTRDGRPYILFNLTDRSGRVGGVYWNVPDEVIQSCPPGDAVLVTGDVRLYNQRLQVVALDLQPYQPESMAEFARSSKRDRDEMIEELRQVIADLSQPLNDLLAKILLAPLFLRRYADAPAAKMMHAELYSTVDLDLLIAGVLLHDVGKVFSYEPNATFPITDEEKLVGHIVKGSMIVERAAQEMADFPPDLLQNLLHLLISHHGSQEWGSPVLPRTIEAVLLHQVDLLDSRAQGFIDHITAEPEGSEWTSRSAMFGYELMRKTK